MVRIIPNRLKASTANINYNPPIDSPNSGTMKSKGDSICPEGLKDTGLVLTVAVVQARNLAAKDRSGTSDPYLVLSLGETKHVTHSVPKTLNPEWNEQCRMPISDTRSLVLGVCCWDKDRFGKDYLGEFDLALEEIFSGDKVELPPKWFPLKSKRPGKKTGVVSGEVLLQFTLSDSTNKQATAQQVFEKLSAITGGLPACSSPRSLTPMPTPSPGIVTPTQSQQLAAAAADPESGIADEDEDYEIYDDETPEDEDLNKTESLEKRRRRLRIKGLKRKKRDNPYEFTNGGSDVVGIIFLEIGNITDLPPESNFTKTSFDMDPFVVASLGKKTYRTKTIRHNLNPVFNEKMIFHVMGHEQTYSFAFTVIDHDKYSNNDFIASTTLPIKELIDRSPKADPETGLYNLRDPPEYVPVQQRSRLKRLGMSRSSSAQSLNKLGRPPPPSKTGTPASSSALSSSAAAPAAASPSPAPSPAEENTAGLTPRVPSPGLLTPGDFPSGPAPPTAGEAGPPEGEDTDFHTYTLPLKMKNLDKWEDKHNPQLFVRAKYMPYPALRQQFWRAMLKQYDTDESGRISKVELTTMLDTLGSTLRESTIDSFFHRFPHKVSNGDESWDLTMDEAALCLEDQLQAKSKGPSVADRVKGLLPDADKVKTLLPVPGKAPEPAASSPGVSASTSSTSLSEVESQSQSQQPTTSSSTIAIPELNTPGEEGEVLDRDDLNASGSEEHVVEIRECPICHQPRLNKRKDADIITHIATCASQDWRQVNNLMMAGFVTASQAQRKWYSKIITKISYGGYKLGANSANILVQDRITGQINEEKMSVYVRLGIRLLYKGLKSNKMENKRIRKLLRGLSFKQGRKFDDPASKDEIQKFIEFHQLDMSEVLLPIEEFKNFNEFFYRALKPGARPASAPNNPHIIVSPADCRSVVYNRVDTATKVWVKGREFCIKRLLGDAYPEDVQRYGAGGSLGIFRLAPQDYHRFHIPVDGIMGKPKIIAGEYYTVNPMAIRSALDVYGENVRVLVPIDSAVHGRVMVVCVGAMMVGSVEITKKEGDEVKRGDELGYFKFGGSTILLLFEEGKMKYDDDLVDNSNGALETLVRVGMSVGHSPHVPRFAPDMPKDENEITEEEKKEAKRRIQGSISEESPDESGGDDMTPITSAVSSAHLGS